MFSNAYNVKSMKYSQQLKIKISFKMVKWKNDFFLLGLYSLPVNKGRSILPLGNRT